MSVNDELSKLISTIEKALQEIKSQISGSASCSPLSLISPDTKLLDDLKLPTRLYRVLDDHNIRSKHAICNLTGTEFSRFKNAGKVSYFQLLDALDTLGLNHRLREESSSRTIRKWMKS